MSDQKKGVLAALFEGFFLAIWAIASKVLGSFDPGVGQYATVLVFAGIGQICLNFLPVKGGKKEDRWSLRIPRKWMGYLFAFILISVAQFYLGVKVYEDKEADVAISSFLRNSSLIFAAVLAHFARSLGGVFEESRLTKRAILGIILFTAGTWVFFGAPMRRGNFETYLSFWVLGSIMVGFNRALTEMIMQMLVKGVRREQANLVIGLGLFFFGIVGLVISKFNLNNSISVWLSMLAVGLIVPAMQGCRFMALTYLREVLGKKGFTIWVYLLLSTLAGWLFLAEPLSLYKVAGLFCGFIAVTLLDPGTFTWVLSQVKRLR